MATLPILDVQQLQYNQVADYGQAWVGDFGLDPIATQVKVYADYGKTDLIDTPLKLNINGRPLHPVTGVALSAIYAQNDSYSFNLTDKNGVPYLVDAIQFSLS